MKEGLSNNTDHLFRDKLMNYSQNPPEEVWGAIEHDLARSRKRVVLPLFFKIAAGILILISLGTLTWTYMRNDNTTNKQLVSTASPSAQEIRNEEKQITTIPAEMQSQSKIKETNTLVIVSRKENEPTNETHESTMVASAVGNDQIINIYPEEVYIPQPEQTTELVVAESNNISPENNSSVIKETETVVEKTPAINKNELIIQQNILALEEDKKENKDDQSIAWSVGGQAGPQYSYRHVDINEPDPYLNNRNKNQYEDPILAYAGGVQIEMEPTNRFSLQSGVFYSKIGHQRVTSIPSDMREDLFTSYNPDMGPINYTGSLPDEKQNIAYYDDIGMEPGILEVDRYLEFVEVPLIFSYLLVDKKLNVDINSGLWADILVGNKALVEVNESPTGEYTNDNINNFNFSASLGIGFDYPLMKKVKLSLNPVFKYYLTPINSDPETNIYPYSLGLMTGIQYTF